MSNETAVATIEIVKKKLKKYTALKEHDKVKEYLGKLHKTSLSPSLIQETKIDIIVRHLASNKNASYNSYAKKLLKKWHHKNLLSNSNKLAISNDTSETVSDSNTNDYVTNTNIPNESQSSNDNKIRKVFSLAQYLETKKPALLSSDTINSAQNKLTDTQIEVINAQFNAVTEKLTANASDLADIVNKSLTERDKVQTNRIETIVKSSIDEQCKSKLDDLWTEEDEEDDYNQSKTVNNNDSNSVHNRTHR